MTDRNDNGDGAGSGGSRDGKLHIDKATPKKPDPSGFYAVLGVAADADAAAIRKAYLHQSTLFHTDRHVEGSDAIRQVMNERFQKINEAYQILSDPRRRAAYDCAGGVGVERLDLIPGNLSERSDVVRALDALEREAEVRRLAKMIGSSGSVEINLNLAAAFAQRVGPGAAATPPRRRAAAAADAAAAAPAAAPASSGPAERKAGSPHLQLSAAQMSVTVAEINGVRKLVLVPADGVLEQALPPEAKAQLTKLLGGDGDGAPRSSSSGGAGALAIIDSIKGAHQFQHAVGSRLAFLVRADAKQEKRASSGSLLLRAVYLHSTIVNFAAAVRVSLDRFKLGVMMTRTLSPVWTLVTKLQVFNGRQWFPELAVSLRRMLSEKVTLTSGVKWTFLDNGGSFSCSLSQQGADEKSARGLVLSISRQSLNLSLFRQSALRWSVGPWTGDGSHLISVALDCLKGTTTASCQLWWDRTAFYSLGFGVTHQLPITLSPFAPPFFLVSSPRFIGFTQYSLLYRRGEHTVSIPAVVSLTPNALAALAVAAAPFLIWHAAMRIARPILTIKAARKAGARRRECAAEVEAAKQKAATEQEAIRAEVISRQQREGKNGLIIMNAKYGVLHPALPVLDGDPRPDVVDVTLSLQSYVRDSQLDLPAGELHRLVGFYDPDPSSDEAKHLRIQYWWNQKKHEVEIADGTPLHLPDDEHRVRAPAV